METIIYIVLSVILTAGWHLFSGIKSGCFYFAMRNEGNLESPALLKKYIKNLHFAQTPIWYGLFGGFGFMLLAILRLLNPQYILLNIGVALLITMGTSACVSVFYQGYVNTGSGKPFIDPLENKSMELANPFNNKTIWIKRFWHGKNRVYVSIGGLLMIIFGFILIATM